jgi:hypothetical protein
MMDFLRKRANERSTAVTLVAITLLFFGPTLAPEHRDTITNLVLALLGLGAAVPDGAVVNSKE